MTKVCEGLRPSLRDCPQSICPLIESCWDGTPSNRPCLPFFLFFSFNTSLVFFHFITNHMVCTAFSDIVKTLRELSQSS